MKYDLCTSAPKLSTDRTQMRIIIAQTVRAVCADKRSMKTAKCDFFSVCVVCYLLKRNIVFQFDNYLFWLSVWMYFTILKNKHCRSDSCKQGKLTWTVQSKQTATGNTDKTLVCIHLKTADSVFVVVDLSISLTQKTMSLIYTLLFLTSTRNQPTRSAWQIAGM